jgi:hypothetical protein
MQSVKKAAKLLPHNSAIILQKFFLKKMGVNTHSRQKVNSSGNHTSGDISCTQLQQSVIKIQDDSYSTIGIFLDCHYAKLLCFYIDYDLLERGGRI